MNSQLRSIPILSTNQSCPRVIAMLALAVAAHFSSAILAESFFQPAQAHPYPSQRSRQRGQHRDRSVIRAPRPFYYPHGYGYGYGSSLSIQSGGLSITIGGASPYGYGYPQRFYRIHPGRPIFVQPPVIINPSVYPETYYYPNYPAPITQPRVRQPATIRYDRQGNVVGPGNEAAGTMIQAPFGVQISR